ncbi:hypothetical protein [Enterococcus termitis]|uniref:Uncharacterized protein n=1 Tax=Enterococcus termitis TaxID=332950 RepID=A0A1E5GIQ7_9ENTE|nr:hypothetical protein [Enterococcus termitis]OEG12475.1 hypothetical protein BCR25_08025 [Enterococcus termitis]
MSKKLVTCGKCGEYTPVVYRTKYLGSGIQHTYAVCQSCGDKVTVYYTDKELRQLLKRQEKTPYGPKKVALAETINNKMNELKERYG